MASFNVYIVFGVLVIMTSGAVIAHDVDPIKTNNCETKMTMHCVIEGFTSIFKTETIFDNCCHELVGLGQLCHNALVKKTLQNPLFKNNDTSVIFSRTVQVWNKYILVGENVSPTPSPLEGGKVMAHDVDMIKANNCETKMTMDCVIEVFTSIFKTVTVFDNCCHELIGLGQLCHNALVKKTLENPLFKNNDTLVILSRTIQVWNKCTLVGEDVSPTPSP
ncbi:Uncharacterized protein TCM_031457 [Theobroma cacao]|uniref:Prolamin-like domain-containing protein n=1 Tax=Theobroma cacao TaxID=3641 RepID=A0A061FEN9_THECC|nr:Uncharacterized protein TCM_031457 [Theobroma cacao]